MGNLVAIRSNCHSLFRIGIFSNTRLIAAVALVMALQYTITYLLPLQSIFHTETLSLQEFLVVAGASSLVFLAVEIEKAVFRRKEKH
jgi:P-type Ca2+ transporter type 2C